MDKYGVVQDIDLVKTAGAEHKCPACGTAIKADAETETIICPKCGTRPFEVRKKAREESEEEG